MCVCVFGGGGVFQQLFQCKMGNTPRPHPQQTYYEQLAVYCRLHCIASFVKINTYFAVLILDAICS